MKKIFLLAALCVTPLLALASDPAAAAPASVSVARDSRCFELRTYYPAPGKFEELHKRFRDHTNKLFVKHGMELVAYWVPSDKDKGEKLIYVLAHKSREAAQKSWKEFMEDPEWKKVHAESEVNGKLVEKVESIYMLATDYSPMK
jgi:hypothetical protein